MTAAFFDGAPIVYGAVFESNGSTYTTPTRQHPFTSGSFLELPGVPCMIHISWSGDTAAYVRHLDSSNEERGVIAEIPWGTRPRQSRSVLGRATGCSYAPVRMRPPGRRERSPYSQWGSNRAVVA